MIGCLGPIQKPILSSTMSWDKMVDRAIGTKRVALGILFLTKTLELTIEDYKLQQFLDRLWHEKALQLLTQQDLSVMSLLVYKYAHG